MSEAFRAESKKEWNRPAGENLTTDDLKLGCLQRIADACELMARYWDQIRRDRDYQKERAESAEREIKKLRRQAAAYRGLAAKAGAS